MLLTFALTLVAHVGSDDSAWFESEVRPVFAAHCASCHSGADADAGLDLAMVSGIAAAIDVTGLVARGDADGSRLVRAVRYTDAGLRMPPKGRIDDASIAVIEEWVRRGAPLPEGAAASAPPAAFDLETRWREHWSWRPVADPEPPQVAHDSRVRDPLDAYVFEGIETAGLVPADEAERAVWLRRATYAVTGLPPTPDEIAAFLADPSADAHERAVDRLLASPRYGERFGRHWLDLVRFAQTKAHEYDFPIPNAHAYRDYVVRAFDADVPYDRLVMEHVAGDLLAAADEGPRLDPTGRFDESVLGTGWWFLHEDVHSPVDTRADECDRIANQVDTLSKAVLGLTVACARCHDHKFDAISAQDYHALAGFALSTSYGQVRYETAEIERRVAGELALLRARNDGARRAATADFLEREIEALAAHLDDARDVVLHGSRGDGAASTVHAALDAPWMDLLLEDFEGDTFEGGLGPWTASGTAFCDRPARRSDCPSWHDVRGHRGNGFVNSHAGHAVSDSGAGDAPIGRLTSAAFVVERRHLHFLVSGGDHESTQVVLERREGDTWTAIRRTTGHRSNEYRARRFDVADVLGEEVRFVLIDEAVGGWGHIGFDHVVASDDPSAAALDRARTRAAWNAAAARVGDMESERALEVLRVATRIERSLESDPTGALSRFVAAASPHAPPASPRTSPLTTQRVLVDYGGDAPLLQNGAAFSLRAAGGLVASADGRPSLLPYAAAVAEPGFHVLRAAPDSERHGGDLDYDQAGTTLITPTFELATGRVAYLVRGRARVFACVDSHRMLHAPLHLETLMSFDTGGAWQLVEHDLSRHVGADVRIEFTAAVDGAPLDLSVARIVEFDSRGEARALEGPDLEPGVGTSDELVAVLRTQVARFRERAGGSPSLDRLLLDARAEGRLGPLLLVLAPYDEEERAVLAQLQHTSRLAPAAFELEGRDDFVLRRGDPSSPTVPAPRRDLSAARLSVGATDDALAETGAGSGRLALARAFADPRHPLVARVWTNRVWHHLFGAGIVATCDDFGVMGAAPSHPELLDALARDFVADGWSTKSLIRRVLLSDAYRRVSVTDERALAIDPTNLWLARAPLRRLEAEAVRDALLFVSGALDETRFGPAVPVHLTTFMSGRGRPGDSGPLDGANRRSIYQVVRRNFIAPFMAVWDFPVPSETRGVRSVGNVPAQALALMNDPFVALCAQRFGESAAARAGDDAERVEWMFLSAFGRPPTARESMVALDLLRSAGEDAGARDAAFADLAQTLFMIEEFVWLP